MSKSRYDLWYRDSIKYLEFCGTFDSMDAMDKYIIEEDLDLKKLEVEELDEYGTIKALFKPKLTLRKLND